MKLKKLTAIVLAGAMALSMSFPSFAEEGVGGEEVHFEPGELTVADASELPRYKIAFSYYSFTDKLGLQFHEAIQYLCDAYNCEAVFFESAFGDEGVSGIESVLAAGDVDGVIYVGSMPALVAVAEKYKVPYVSVCGFSSLQEELDTLSGYEYFLGGVIDDDVWAGEHAMQALYDAGSRNVCLEGMTQGMVKSHDDRAEAYRNFVASHDDMTSLSEVYADGTTTSNDISTFAASFIGLMDGLFCTAGSDAIYLSMETSGIADGSVKLVTVDISSQTATYLQNGTQIWTCGGQYGTAEMGFAVLYSYLADGVRIIEDNTVPIIRQYLEITSYDDYVDYCKYVESDVPVYTADEIAAFIPHFTEGVDLSTYEEEAKNYSLESLAARR